MLISRRIITAVGLVLSGSAAQAQTAPWDTVPLQTSNSPFVLSLPGGAETPPPAQNAEPFALGSAGVVQQANVQGAAPARPQVDESALRYYAHNGEIGRVSAEINRLKSLHPDWEPPEDIFDSNKTVVNEQPLWDLFAAGKSQELYAKIREFIKLYPGYAPSGELRRQIMNAEARKTVLSASEVGNYADVVKTVAKNPTLLVCQEMDMIWRTAEALYKTGREAEAFAAYQYILANCSNPDERVATVQKAAETLPRQAVEKLITFGRAGIDGQSEFNDIFLNIVRGEVGKAAADEMLLVERADLEALTRSAKLQQNPGDAELLGWYYYSRQDYEQAAEWFNASLKLRPSVKAIEGIVISLKGAGAYEEAENLAYENRRKDPLILKAYLEVMSIQILDNLDRELDFKRLSRFANSIEEAESANGAQVLGWHFYELYDFDEAETWFDKSMKFHPNEAAVVGLILVAQRNKQTKRQNQLIADWSGDFPAVEALNTVRRASASSTQKRSSGGSKSYSNSSLTSARNAFNSGNYKEAVALLERNALRGRETRTTQLLRGWALFNSGRSKEAHKIFAAADAQRSTKETRQGKWFSEKAMYKYQ
ncbi:tetratricopeptide repeat protein [uncultured Roseibium sp.]|uniref:tetratricopeptide repeat protein n=1 Tax=uncultured Roseibium sp. TaxID=1936171 RepID=UPI002604DF30|nr:tetratricopeptide repeat protein [uncultured Roseibium sp.]